ncbi:MAG: hypothetical protein U0V56_03215 [Actinomycetota bacterium]
MAAILAVRSPGWPQIEQFALQRRGVPGELPEISQFWRNVFIFCVAEVLVLLLALLLAVMRSLPGPVFTPLRVLAAAYTDLFGRSPRSWVIAILGFGMPAPAAEGLPTRTSSGRSSRSRSCTQRTWPRCTGRGMIRCIRGRPPVRSGFRGQAMRTVVLPQAVRRAIRPC